jgi:hypothetical protein
VPTCLRRTLAGVGSQGAASDTKVGPWVRQALLADLMGSLMLANLDYLGCKLEERERI